jgi:O-antigen biosynthesis protein
MKTYLLGSDDSSITNPPAHPSLVKRLNEHWGSGALVKKVKGLIRGNAPSVYSKLKLHLGLTNKESLWIDGLPPQESAVLSFLRQFDPTLDEVAQNCHLNSEFVCSKEPARVINWFISDIGPAWYAGINTILRFANRLQTFHGVRNNIVIYNAPDRDIERVQKRVQQIFPALAGNVLIYSVDRSDELPASDACIATYWTSAFLVSKVTNTRSKFYFIQDYEPLFYDGGPIYGLVDTTYRLGLLRIVNTSGLLEFIKSQHGGEGTTFIPCVDGNLFFPRPKATSTSGKVKIFFYARPSYARNGFMLGLEALRRIKARYGEGVEIVTAGEEWEPRKYGAGSILTNLGLLKEAREVAELYRSCDIGLIFMFTKHPSYQPFEFMASGCCVVTNENNATKWLLENGHNALLTEPTIESVERAIGNLVEDADLRQRLIEASFAKMPKQGWDETIDQACRHAGLIG